MIEVKKVFFNYPAGVEALKDVTLTIEDSDFVAIMGENGAGKTTLAKHFNGLLKPTRGDVFVDGINTKKATVAELSRNVGLVFQNPDHQLFSETVEEEIRFGLRNFGFSTNDINQQIDWVLKLLSIEKYRKTSPLMLSGGEKKRVALATVLAWDPKIIILDEPTIGQDYAQKKMLREFIGQLILQGKTVIIITHDVEFVAECNPRVVIMSKGRVISDGPAKHILTNQEIISQASILLPEISQLFYQLVDLGLPYDIIDVEEAKQVIEDLIRGNVS